MKVGDRSRCLKCGAKIELIKHPHIISLDTGLWVHQSAVARFVNLHPAQGPQ